MKKVMATEIQSHFFDYLQLAATENIVIVRNGQPVGMLIGLMDENEADDAIESDPRFLRRIAAARRSLRAGKGIRLEDMDVKL